MNSKKEINSNLREHWNQIPKRGILPHELKLLMWKNICRATIRKRRQKYKWMLTACAVVAMLSANYFITTDFDSKEITTTKTASADIRLLHLPDGSRVWINQNTEIEYSTSFSGKERKITLSGEAFFEVARDTARPFIITSGEVTTTVLGTSFNILAYEGQTNKVSVKSGKVKVEANHRKVFLEKGFESVTSSDDGIISKQKTNIVEPSWKKVLIDVDRKTLAQVISQLQAIYPIEVEYANPQLQQNIIRGALDTRNGLDEMLQTIAFALEIDIKCTGNNKYYISK